MHDYLVGYGWMLPPYLREERKTLASETILPGARVLGPANHSSQHGDVLAVSRSGQVTDGLGATSARSQSLERGSWNRMIICIQSAIRLLSLLPISACMTLRM